MDPQVPEPETAPPSHPLRRRGPVREVIDTLLLAAVLYAAVRALVVPYGVEGASMDPNLHNGERLFVNRNAYVSYDANWFRNLLPGDDREGADIVYPFDGPERGDIVVFDPPVPDPDKPYIKRVIGLPGETVTFRDGRVYIDGRVLDEDYIEGAITDCPRSEECVLGPIPEDHVVVLGDNRAHSRDSRDFGYVAVDQIIGKAVFANWPVEDFGRLPQPEYETE
ncbi:MAG: Signal peptidase I [uncultured Thermomicrobiales bacterium]|uniref:Signal peptidase I n=1 Tax=uncultured Thermomicrobiales bacterium TaxID=1645740 RepID=A0A6J4U916_9BACT|nr:MAG: Signal peptidase I [uncultured Thermomicrobiales bacterium]